VDNSEADEFSEVFSKPLKSLPYDSPGQIFVAFEKPEGVPTLGEFSNVLKFIVREVLVPFIYGVLLFDPVPICIMIKCIFQA
jgi:coatomer protein complex subunit gamma